MNPATMAVGFAATMLRTVYTAAKSAATPAILHSDVRRGKAAHRGAGLSPPHDLGNAKV